MRIPALALAALAVTALPASACFVVAPQGSFGARVLASECTGDTAAQPFRVAVGSEVATGLVAKPRRAPRGIVVAAHGYGHTVESWRAHLERIADESGVIAVAMNYRHQVGTRGWRVAEGAEDSIAAARYFERACPSARRIALYGVSMGGNTSGLALAAKPTRANGRPLFDVWFDIEGANNVVETYFEARALAPTGNATAVNAVADIEEEMGGTFEEKAEVYLRHSNVARIADIAASGVSDVYLVHGLVDGLVPYNQSAEFRALLRAHRVPAAMTTVVTRTATSEPGTTVDGYLPIPGHTSPFAGHASEASTTHVVGMEGFQLLRDWFDGSATRCVDVVYDGTTGVRTPGVPAC